MGKWEMMDLLLGACPSFAPQWQEFQQEWAADWDNSPLYVALGDFSRHLIELLERRQLDQLRIALSAVERLHIEGDAYVRDAAMVGILESLDNRNLHKTTQPDDLYPYLGPESRRWWDEWSETALS